MQLARTQKTGEKNNLLTKIKNIMAKVEKVTTQEWMSCEIESEVTW